MNCEHKSFECNVNVNRIEDIGRFQADVTVKCTDCGTPFRFIGLPTGLDLNGAAVSIDGTEARLAIAPRGEVQTPLDPDAVGGFTVRREAATEADYRTCPKCGGHMAHYRLKGYRCPRCE